MSIRRLSLEADVDSPSLRFDYGADPNNVQTFDRDNILGCKCDPGYEGYDCSKRKYHVCIVRMKPSHSLFMIDQAPVLGAMIQ